VVNQKNTHFIFWSQICHFDLNLESETIVAEEAALPSTLLERGRGGVRGGYWPHSSLIPVCLHCKAVAHRIGLHNTSKGIKRYFLRIKKSLSGVLTSKNEVIYSVLKICVCVLFM
jgi:hypothetical protein